MNSGFGIQCNPFKEHEVFSSATKIEHHQENMGSFVVHSMTYIEEKDVKKETTKVPRTNVQSYLKKTFIPIFVQG